MEIKLLDNPHGLVQYQPFVENKGDAGIDLITMEDVFVFPGEINKINTGVCVKIPHGNFGLVTHRSSMAFKLGCICSTGIIDSSYRGEIKLVFFNLTKEAVFVKKGSRVAQLVVIPFNVKESYLTEVDTLEETVRGSNGFGSTGV